MNFVTAAPGKEYKTLYKNHHEDPKLEKLFLDFKTSSNKALWLSENRDVLTKYDINVDSLIDVWRSNIDYVQTGYLEGCDTAVFELVYND